MCKILTLVNEIRCIVQFRFPYYHMTRCTLYIKSPFLKAWGPCRAPCGTKPCHTVLQVYCRTMFCYFCSQFRCCMLSCSLHYPDHNWMAFVILYTFVFRHLSVPLHSGQQLKVSVFISSCFHPSWGMEG